MRIRRGQRLTNIYQGAWEASPGVELPGVAGSTWHYSVCYLELDSGEIYALTQSSIEPASLGGTVEKVPEMQGELPASVVDVVRNDVGDVLVLLSGGRCLENAYLPGGSRVVLSLLTEWSAEDLDEERTSILDGHTVTLRVYLNGPEDRV